MIDQVIWWKRDAEKHARKEAPREACGFLMRVDGEEMYFPAENVHPQPTQRFAISPDDWVSAEAGGAVLAVVHSHPVGSANASAADQAMCDRMGLPWWIYGVQVDLWKRIEPGTEPPALLGREFIYGVVDCYTLVRDAFAQLANVDLPEFERGMQPMSAETHLYTEHFGDAGFEALPDSEPLRPMDLIVMQINARQPNHGAVYLGDGLMLHHPAGRLSMRDQYGGPWLRQTRMRLRHRALRDVALDTIRVTR